MAEKEYIEKGKINDYISKLREYVSASVGLSQAEYSFISDILTAFENFPTADVVPVKHGHFRRLTFSGDTIICSECKMAYNIFETNGAENFNFCPHCGAKIMDGGEGE